MSLLTNADVLRKLGVNPAQAKLAGLQLNAAYYAVEPSPLPDAAVVDDSDPPPPLDEASLRAMRQVHRANRRMIVC